MKSLPIIAVCSLLAAPAAAQEAHSWTGFYVGINGGGGFMEETTSDYQTYITGYGPTTAMVDSVSGFAGGTIGFNAQFGMAVIGVEADAQWSGFDASTTWAFDSMTNKAAWDWFGTVRLRAGVALDRALVYVTGGAAFVGTDFGYGQIVPIASDYYVTSDDIEWGFTAGAGVEYALTDHLVLKSEYLYVGLPTKDISVPTGAPGFNNDYSFKSSAHLGRVGLGYKF